MRISRLQLHNFRGWADFDLRPRSHVMLAGVPRAGRSDIVAALIRLLDPAFIRVQPTLTDIRQQCTPAENREGTGATGSDDNRLAARDETGTADGSSATGCTIAYGEVTATLVELDPELEQLCDGFLEPLDGDDQVDESDSAAPDAPLGVRLSYRVSYDHDKDSLDHAVFFPLRSNPTTGQYARVPAAVRQALPVVVLNTQRPLQLRAEGMLRRLVTNQDADASSVAFRALEREIAAAADRLSADTTIAATVEAVLQAGGLARRLADSPPTAAKVRFRPDDGSLSALLRAVQPALELDEAGLLGLSNHGSTAAAVLAAAEAMLLASSVEGAVVLGDDLGDSLDAATAEHLAAVLRAQTAQVWLTTRRPEVARAFAPGELVRLSRISGTRSHHLLLEPADLHVGVFTRTGVPVPVLQR